MAGFIDINGLYYEGDRASIDDIIVPSRPSQYHKYDNTSKKWIIDEEKVLKLKKQILNHLDEELRTKTVLLNLSDEEKEAVNKLYNEKVQELSKTNDPIILQEIRF